jgi:hypothetical protein
VHLPARSCEPRQRAHVGDRMRARGRLLGGCPRKALRFRLRLARFFAGLMGCSPSRTASSRTRTSGAMEFLIVDAPCRFSHSSMVRSMMPGGDLGDRQVPERGQHPQLEPVPVGLPGGGRVQAARPSVADRGDELGERHGHVHALGRGVAAASRRRRAPQPRPDDLRADDAALADRVGPAGAGADAVGAAFHVGGDLHADRRHRFGLRCGSGSAFRGMIVLQAGQPGSTASSRYRAIPPSRRNGGP